MRFVQQPSSQGIAFLAQAVPEIDNESKIEIMRRLVAEIPWGHNILILQKTETVQERIYYLLASSAGAEASC